MQANRDSTRRRISALSFRVILEPAQDDGLLEIFSQI
jgi:hypothetical protein